MDEIQTMQPLNLPAFPFRIQQQEGKPFIFDPFRKKFISLTPEEWVRQNFLAWLTVHKGYPAGLIAVEAPLKYNKLQKRADAIVYDRKGSPVLIVECKAAEIKITQEVFHQVARYNFSFGVFYLVVTNGIEHFCCRKLTSDTDWVFLEQVPDFDML